MHPNMLDGIYAYVEEDGHVVFAFKGQFEIRKKMVTYRCISDNSLAAACSVRHFLSEKRRADVVWLVNGGKQSFKVKITANKISGRVILTSGRSVKSLKTGSGTECSEVAVRLLPQRFDIELIPCHQSYLTGAASLHKFWDGVKAVFLSGR